MTESILTSTVIPTVGRPKLGRAVASVLGQDAPQPFEVIVVNDSGAPLPAAAWQSDRRVVVLQTGRVERCIARNIGAERAHGRFLHFLDDDDWLLPGGLAALQTGAGSSRFVFGATRLVDRRGEPLIDLEHRLSGNVAVQVMCGEWIPLQSSLIERAVFFKLGGFHEWQAGSEDIDLVRRAAIATDFDHLPTPVSAVTMGAAGSTTDHTRQLARGRRGRELILDQPETFRRMRRSAGAPGWHGGIVRIYWTSAAWNLARLRLPVAARRLAYGWAALLRSGPDALRGGFWQGLLRPYRSVTFERALAEKGRRDQQG